MELGLALVVTRSYVQIAGSQKQAMDVCVGSLKNLGTRSGGDIVTLLLTIFSKGPYPFSRGSYPFSDTTYPLSNPISSFLFPLGKGEKGYCYGLSKRCFQLVFPLHQLMWCFGKVFPYGYSGIYTMVFLAYLQWKHRNTRKHQETRGKTRNTLETPDDTCQNHSLGL